MKVVRRYMSHGTLFAQVDTAEGRCVIGPAENVPDSEILAMAAKWSEYQAMATDAMKAWAKRAAAVPHGHDPV